jgi:hypothetical protein
MRYVFLPALILSAALTLACSRKPAYSDIQVNQANSNQSQAAQSEPTPNPVAEEIGKLEQKPPAQAQAEQSPGQAARLKVPDFMDLEKGQIKDLPTYPGAVVTNVQYGPINGIDSAMMMLQARGSMTELAAFYDRAVKSNGWTIVRNTRDADNYRVQLLKADKGEAVIEIKKDTRSNFYYIMLSRAGSAPQPKQ